MDKLTQYQFSKSRYSTMLMSPDELLQVEDPDIIEEYLALLDFAKFIARERLVKLYSELKQKPTS